MSDATEPPFARRLFTTPLTQLVRGRVTGRRPSPAGLAALPAEARGLVVRVARRTRLWRGERADVSAELAGHFADGLAAGSTAGELVAAFGDERRVARLIRRAKIRNRPALWHAWRFTRRAAAALLVVYAALAGRYFLGRPTVSVDYLADLNAAIGRVPADQRAWPLYQRAAAELDLPGLDTRPTSNLSRTELAAQSDRQLEFNRMLDAQPGWRRWDDLGRWLDAHAAGVELLRQAAAKPALGFVLGPNGSQREPPFYDDDGDRPADGPFPLIELRMPAGRLVWTSAQIVAGDLRRRSRGDGDRVVRDFDAMQSMAAQGGGTRFFPDTYQSQQTYRLALRELDRTLALAPQVLDDRALVRLAHRLSEIGRDAPLVDPKQERLFFYDLVQRAYTNDGHGDGRFTPTGTRALFQPSPHRSILDRDADWDDVATDSVAPVGLMASRREVVAEYDRLMDVYDAQCRRPARDIDLSAQYARLRELRAPPVLRRRFLPVVQRFPGISYSLVRAEQSLGKRDGLTVAIALELYRRRHGGADAPTLDALVPELLPSVPADRMTGDPIKYRVADGKPVVYSVGEDLDDDGGRSPPRTGEYVNEYDVARWWNLWGSGLAKGARPAGWGHDGDWVLFPGPVEPPEPPDRPSEE